MSSNESSRRQGRYWLLTIPANLWTPCLPDGVAYCKGQKEKGTQTSYEHWQVLCVTEKKQSINGIKSIFGIPQLHAELSRSDAADAYVWKEETRIEDTQFEFGKKKVRRNSQQDWGNVWELAKSGDFEAIDPEIRLRHYHALRKISYDYTKPVAMERVCLVYWGKTGAGKSRRAWAEAGLDAYPKNPRTKFWCGYRGEENVVIDEFRGDIDIANMLRWLDRYPVLIETKGSGTVLKAKRIWITSNLPPSRWYPNADYETVQALERRLIVTEFDGTENEIDESLEIE